MPRLPAAANRGERLRRFRAVPPRRLLPMAMQVLETDAGLISGVHAYVFPELFTYSGFPAAF